MEIRTKSPDLILIFVIMTLLGIGIVIVFSASAVYAGIEFNDSYYFLKRQLIWVFLGLIAMLFMNKLDYWHLKKLARPIFLLTLVLLILVLIPGIGMEIKGARRWLNLGFTAFQPSEFAKLAVVIFMADFLTKRQDKIGKFGAGLIPPLLILGVVFGLVLKEPDLGTALVIGGVVFVMLFVTGARILHLGGLAVMGIADIVAAIVVAPYRMRRITSFLDPWSDPTDSGYHIIQSLYALGSGGIFGLGLGQSREKFLYLPEPHTDFIFAILGEELGFIGTALVVILFFLLVWRGFKIAIAAKDTFGSILAAGVTSMIAIQAVLNIGVVTASLPVTGVPLPFISFGGSALTVMLAGVGILMNISKHTYHK